MRRSSRGRRNEQDFQTAKAHLDKLRAACGAADHDFDLIYFDGAGFSLIPSVPYAWQLRGETLEIPSVHSPRLNVLGFLEPPRNSRRQFSLSQAATADSSCWR